MRGGSAKKCTAPPGSGMFLHMCALAGIKRIATWKCVILKGESVCASVCTFSFLLFSLSCMRLAADGPELSHVNQEIIKENTRKIHFHSRPSREIELAPSHYDDCVHRLYVNATSSSLACTTF